MGASLFAGIPFKFFFAQRGTAVSVVESSELLYYLSGTLDAETTVVLVSRSGESVEVTKLLPKLAERGCRVIAVVNVPGSTLANAAAETIVVNSPSDRLVAIQTYTGTLAVLALLAASCFDELDSATSELEETIDAVEELVSRSVSGTYSDLWFDGGPLYLLGRGAALASVHTGALLMHEMARRPAVGMSSAQFRHGPVEVVTEEFRAILFGTQPATAALDLALAEDLAGMGASVGWIGPLIENASASRLGWWPEGAPARFASVLEIIPIQVLAFRIAESRGIASGEFRFAPAVTLSETGFLSSAVNK